MPKSIEAEGVTVDEAIQNALNALGLGRDSVEIEIVYHPRSGFLGIGARRAKVRATLREQVMRDGEEFDMAPEGSGRGRRRRRSGRRRSPRGNEGRPADGKQGAPDGQARRTSHAGGPTAESSSTSEPAVPSAPQEGGAGGEPARGSRGGRRRGGRRSGRGGETPRGGSDDQQRSAPGGTAGRRSGGSGSQDDAGQRGEQGEPIKREQRPDSGRTSQAARRVDLDALLLRAIDITTRLVEQMGFEARVTGTIDGGSLSLTVDASDGGAILIGRRGTTLDAIEHLVGRMTLGVEPGSRVRVAVDVCGYRDKRRNALEELATKIKQHAIASGRRAQITPLSPQDRNVFLDVLARDESVTTRALGTGFYRRVLVVPKGIQNDGSAPDDFGEDGNLLTATGGGDREVAMDEGEIGGVSDGADEQAETDGESEDDGHSPGAG